MNQISSRKIEKKAKLSMYLGILSLICCVTAIPAIILGKKSLPHKFAKVGIITGYIGLIFLIMNLLLIGVLVYFVNRDIPKTEKKIEINIDDNKHLGTIK